MKTIKQIADELGVSKTAIRKKIENLGLSDKLSKNGNQFSINKSQEIMIKSAFSKNITETENHKPVTESLGSFQLVSDLVDTLKLQLEAKDKQLEEKDKQLAEQQQSIKALTEALADTANSLKAAQLLHAGTMQKELIGENTGDKTKEQQESSTNVEKKGFLKKFFGKG